MDMNFARVKAVFTLHWIEYENAFVQHEKKPVHPRCEQFAGPNSQRKLDLRHSRG